MTLSDPYAINFLAQSSLKIINHLINVESLPRENQVLVLVLRMLALGLQAWEMISTQQYKEPKLVSLQAAICKANVAVGVELQGSVEVLSFF